MKKFVAAIVGVLSFTLILCACSWKANNKTRNYVAMSTDELAKLSDDELYKAVIARAERTVESKTDLKTGINSLNSPQKIVFSLDWFMMEEDNGGLFQFFVNSSRMVAPFISDYMGAVGAEEHKKLFDDFILKNNIDLSDLSFFDINSDEEYAKKAESYPFDEFDDALYELKPLDTYLKEYIRENIEDF